MLSNYTLENRLKKIPKLYITKVLKYLPQQGGVSNEPLSCRFNGDHHPITVNSYRTGNIPSMLTKAEIMGFSQKLYF